MFDTVAVIREDLASFAHEFDWATLDARGATRMLAEIATIKRLADGLIAQAARRLNQTNAHAATSDRNGIALAARLAGIETSQMKTAVETVQLLDALPATAAAVNAGKLSARESELIAGAAATNPAAESTLLALTGEGLTKLKDECQRVRARAEDADARRERMRVSRTFRMWSDADGMLYGRFALPTAIGAQVKANIDREVQRIFRARRRGTDHEPHDRYAADALCAFVMIGATVYETQDRTDTNDNEARMPNTAATEGQRARSPHNTDSVRTNATVHVLIDHAALVRGVADTGEICEIPGVGPVDVTWVQSLLGSAFVTAIIKRGKDILTVAHLGRNIPAEVQTALVVSGRECSVIACSCRNYLERDHTTDFAQGGPTSFANLDWLCAYHHRLKSAKRYQLGPKDPVTGKRTLQPHGTRAA